MKLEILKYPDPRLKVVAKRVEAFGSDLDSLIEDMFETMYDAPGVGLAATQVGVDLQLSVLDVSPVIPDGEPFVMINPEILREEGEQEAEEGCLSVPDFTAVVSRAEVVSVGFSLPNGKGVELTGEGFLAKAIQHEIDHLNGVLFVDRLSPLKKDIFRRKFNKMKRAGTTA